MRGKTGLLLAVLLVALTMLVVNCGGGGGEGGTTPPPGGGATPLSNAKAISAFSFTTPAATGIIDENAKTITVNVPYGTNVNGLIATFTTTGSIVQVGSTVQVSGTTSNNFTNPVAYTVIAEDSSNLTYFVAVTVAASSAKAITAFSFTTPAATGIIDENAKTITVNVPYGTNVNGLIATFTTTGSIVQVGSTVQVSGTTSNNFTNPVAYTVTAADNATATYTVSVTVAVATKAITAFSFTSPAAIGVINENTKSIVVSMPIRTNISALVATYTSIGTSVKVGTTIQVSGMTANNFTNPVTYAVTAADNTTVTYAVTVTVPAIALPKTGQTICYNSAGTAISCATTGQDGELQKGVVWPNPRFTINADTSVTDNLTGLIFAQNGNLMHTRDPGWDTDITNSVFDGMVTWQHALDYVAKLNTENYLNHNDWRLPNRKELKSLVNYSQYNSAAWLNTQGFINAQTYYYWSSTSNASKADTAWIVGIYNGNGGYMFSNPKSETYYVWPVRGGQNSGAPAEEPQTGQTFCYDSGGVVITCTNTGQDGALQKGVALPNSRFTNADNSTPINGNVVLDHLTGLMWTQDGNALGPVACTPAVQRTWQDALDHVDCLNMIGFLGYYDWRLPNVNELESLVNVSQSNTAIWLHTQGFTLNTQGLTWSDADRYWTSTPYVDSPSGAWFVNMNSGYVASSLVTSNYYVWSVRGGQ